MQITINSDDIIYIRAFLSSYEASNLFVERNKATLDNLNDKLLKLDVALRHNEVSIKDNVILIKC